jgi:hypothetical protein
MRSTRGGLSSDSELAAGAGFESALVGRAENANSRWAAAPWPAAALTMRTSRRSVCAGRCRRRWGTKSAGPELYYQVRRDPHSQPRECPIPSASPGRTDTRRGFCFSATGAGAFCSVKEAAIMRIFVITAALIAGLGLAAAQDQVPLAIKAKLPPRRRPRSRPNP